VPTLGVCLGHQAIVEAFGGEIGPAQKLVHGKASFISHDGRGLFEGLPEDFLAGRYHSLAATRIPDELEVSATCTEGEVMAVRHRELPVDGVQFHPESVLTPIGPDLAKNFLTAALSTKVSTGQFRRVPGGARNPEDGIASDAPVEEATR
jgi:anthranilate synthase/aminodeoxychorismate synthase-like glutamine amidotransferase